MSFGIILRITTIVSLLCLAQTASGAVKTAIIQYEYQDADSVGVDADRVESFVRQAAGNGAGLVILPETCFYRYDPWEQNGVTMLDLANNFTALVDRFSALADELNISLVIGLREPSGDADKPVYNTGLFFGTDGAVLRKQRKIAPSNKEKAWTKEGSQGVFETPYGRMALMICKTAKTSQWSIYNDADIDLFILIAGDDDATSFDRFGDICKAGGYHGVLANQMKPVKDGKGNSAWGYPDGKVTFLGGGEKIFYNTLPIPGGSSFLPGQIIVDPDNPSGLVYNRDDNGDGKLDPFFMCGPGDPEGFLYRGKRNADGTRDGDQMELINKLKANGGNCIYHIAVRTHGGDASSSVSKSPEIYPDDKHNPWIGQDPANGLNQKILDQWETWFTEMDNNGIVILFFIYDDAIRIGSRFGWPLDDSGDLHPGEREFLQTVVNKFKHHKHLIWCVMEEGQEIKEDWHKHVSKIAEAIRQADDHRHVIAAHQLGGNVFYHADDPNIQQFALQTEGDEVKTLDDMHNWMLEAWNNAAGRYNVNMSEDSNHKELNNDAMRKRNWAIAMAGAYVMAIGMDILETPVEQLQDCQRLQRFFESTDFNRMSPHDELKYAGTQYVLAAPGSSYIVYASKPSDDVGLKDMSSGVYSFTWFDCVTGNTVTQDSVSIGSGDQAWSKPAGIGNEMAVYIFPKP